MAGQDQCYHDHAIYVSKLLLNLQMQAVLSAFMKKLGSHIQLMMTLHIPPCEQVRIGLLPCVGVAFETHCPPSTLIGWLVGEMGGARVSGWMIRFSVIAGHT